MAQTTRNTEPYVESFDTSAALLAGVTGGVAFLALQLALAPLLGLGVWEPVRMIAAVLLGPQALAPPATLEVGIALTALVVHFGLSIIYAFALGMIIRGQSALVSTGIGLGFGLLLYGVNFYLFSGLYPWFAEARNWVGIVAHLAYGGVAGWVYMRATVRAFRKRSGAQESYA